MKKLYFLSLFLLGFSTAAFAQVEFTDDFESYDLDYIADQTDYWRTWSGPTGNQEDAMVVNTYANSGSQSVMIPGNEITDVIVLTPSGPTSGIYTIQFSAYIPTGKSGYFNMQSKRTPAGIEWEQSLMGGNVYLNCDGFSGGIGGVTGYTDCREPEASFFYPEGQWFKVTNIYNLDDEVWEMKIDGESQFTDYPLAFSNHSLEELAGLDFYSASDNIEMYIDDLVMGAGVLAVDNFTRDTFSLYPNPVKDVLNIDSKKEINAVTVYDILGKTVIQKTGTAKNMQVDMSHLTSGAYLVKITIDNTSKTFKILK